MMLGFASYAMYSYFFSSYPEEAQLVPVDGRIERAEIFGGRSGSRLEIELSADKSTFIYPSGIGPYEDVIKAAPIGSNITLWVEQADYQKGGRVYIYQMYRGAQEILAYEEGLQADIVDRPWALGAGVCLFVGFVFMSWVAVYQTD